MKNMLKFAFDTRKMYKNEGIKVSMLEILKSCYRVSNTRCKCCGKVFNNAEHDYCPKCGTYPYDDDNEF